MSYEEKGRTPSQIQNVIMENRSKLIVSGVEEVESFDEKEIVMMTSLGPLIVRGNGLRVEKLSVDSGEIRILGQLSELIYEDVAANGSLWSRLFK